MKHKVTFATYLFFVLSFGFCQKSLQAGQKTDEMNKVLDYFKKEKNSEKLQVAQFLITNLSNHFSVVNKWQTQEGDSIAFEVTNFMDIEAATNAFNKLKESTPLIAKQHIVFDAKVITAKYLIDNIELAYKAWKSNTWSRHYSLDVFCKNILPYRSLTEPLENWRADYLLNYQKATLNLVDATDPVEVCANVINNIQNFYFVTSRFDPKPLLGPKELLFWRQGTCPDLANLAVFACRALGVAVTVDFTPHFAASSNRHYWNTVIDNQGEHIPFNGNQNAPYAYKPLDRRMAKIFRATFAEQKQSLANLLSEKDIPADFLKSKNVQDVTTDYLEVANCNHRFAATNTAKVAYINVFNRGSWNVVDWALVENNTATFSKLGKNIVYLPSTFENQKTVFEQFPILINTKGEQTILQPNSAASFAATLTRSNETKNVFNDNNPLQIIAGEKYNLYVWDANWQLVDQQIATPTNSLYFAKVPQNGLFLLAPQKPDFYERIFTINPSTNAITWY